MGKLRSLSVAFVLLLAGAFAGEAAEKLLVCGPCSREFLPVAEKVVRDLQLDVQVEVGAMRCVGYCDQPAVIAFRDEVYVAMDEGKLRAMLEALAK